VRQGFGKTSLKLRVLDLLTHKPIDSVRLTIRFGASADKLIDTLMKQKDGIEYNFVVPEMDNCEAYWFELSNRLYRNDIFSNDTTKHIGIEKGVINKRTLYLKPSTKVKVTVTNELKAFNGDTVFLYLDRKDKKEVDTWGYFTKRHFEETKTTADYLDVESGIDYRVTWIHKNNDLTDTTYREFHAEPFDTLSLNFTMKKTI
jgi:hypothetical protein